MSRLRQAVRVLLPCVLLLGALLSSARAFNLSDHAVKAFIRPARLVAAFEAETLPGAPAAVVQDALAANGRAVRLKPLDPVLAFRQRLERSTYAVWAIARSDKEPSGYREPMYVHLSVKGPNVGPDGRTARQWRMRVNYMASMYQDVAHIYFDADAPGEYEFAFCLGQDSAFDLLVDRLELRDELAGTRKKGFKTAATIYTNVAYDPAKPSTQSAMFPRDEAMKRARDIAASLPPRNAILTSGGMPTKDFYHEIHLADTGLAEPTADRWLWRMNPNLEKPWSMSGPTLPRRDEMEKLDREGGEAAAGPTTAPRGAGNVSFGVTPEDQPDFNWATGKPGPVGSYAAEDYDAFRKLPGRWPDDGGGYFTPKARSGKVGHNFYLNILAGAFKQRLAAMRDRIGDLADQFHKTGDPRIGFIGAVMLAHFANQFPSIDHTVQGSMNVTWGTYPFNCFSGNRAGEFGKLDYSGWAGPNNIPLMLAYDKLFPFIRDNQLLADAIGQNVPWVKTPQDVIELIDVKLVQHFFDVAERGHVRFASVRCDPVVAIVQGPNEAGLAMLRRIVHRSDFQYPAILDTFVGERSRDSTSYIGSMFYAKGPSLDAGAAVAAISDFAQQCRAPDLMLADPAKSLTLYQAAQWLIEPYVCGVHVNGVGDVSGPHGYPTMTLGSDVEPAQRVLYAAWRHYGDARFAWMLDRVYGFPPYADAEQVRKAQTEAAQLPRDPREAQPSRVLEGFGVAILEVNAEHPDFRKRTGVVMRAGYGAGHSHQDSLNLEIFSKGIVATAEFGGRPGYGDPPTTAAQSHCLVTIDDKIETAQTSLLADIPGLPCTEAGFGGDKGEGIAARRFVALVDAGGDDAYLFDVVRGRGGRTRTYWFHGNQTAAVESVKMTETRAPTPASAGGDEDMAELTAGEARKARPAAFVWNPEVFSHSVLPDHRDVVAADDYQAVWPLDRGMEESILNRILQVHPFAQGRKPAALYDPRSPRKFTRLILLGSKGRRVKTVAARSLQVQYLIVCAGISEDKDSAAVSVFPAVIEPFEGEAFVKDCRSLKVESGGRGAPTAARVTLRGGRSDLLYQSDDAEASCRVADRPGLTVQGRFACVSFDAAGPRGVALVGGTAVQSERIGLRLERPSHQAKIAAVDHIRREVRLDAALPATLSTPCDFLFGWDREPFRVVKTRREGDSTVLHFEKTAESYRAPVFAVLGGREVVGPFEPEHRQTRGWLADETTARGWPVVGVASGEIRWMGTSFRGGPNMGGPISWDDVPDADGDGKRTLAIRSHGQWKEDMRVEVLRVDPELRSFAFMPLNTPAGYAGTRSYAGGEIVNETGKRISTSVMPGKMVSFLLPEDARVTEKDFPDADGDGQGRFRVYYFGPGDPATMSAFASAARQADGTWLVAANAPATVTLPGKSAIFLAAADKSWKRLDAQAAEGALTVALGEERLAGGRARLRVE